MSNKDFINGWNKGIKEVLRKVKPDGLGYVMTQEVFLGLKEHFLSKKKHMENKP